MALTRKLLSGMGLTDEQVETIIAEHTSVTTGLKDKVDELNNTISELNDQLATAKDVQKELDDLKAQAGNDAKEHDAQDAKYKALEKEFNDYKAEQERKAVHAEKEKAYREILKDAGIAERHFDKILKYSDVDGVELDEKGKITTAKELLKSIKEEWSDHIQSTSVQGAGAETPPEGTGKKMTVAEIDAIQDTAERQKAILENHELFGF